MSFVVYTFRLVSSQPYIIARYIIWHGPIFSLFYISLFYISLFYISLLYISLIQSSKIKISSIPHNIVCLLTVKMN